MILADTSIWIDHFRRADDRLATLIRQNQVLIHPFVIGELAVGSLAARERTLIDLGRLPSLLPSRHGEVMSMIETHRLHGMGISWVDAHLLCSIRLRAGGKLWTRDRRLHRAAELLGAAASA